MRQLIIILITAFVGLSANAQVTASLSNISNTATTDIVRVQYTATTTLTGVDINPINVYFKIPGDGSGVTWALTSNPFNLLEGFHFSDGGFYYRAYQSVTATSVGTFPMGTPVTIAEVSITGFDGEVILTGGDFPSGGSNFPGSALVQDGTNLLTWPVSEATSLPISMRSFDVTKKGEDGAALKWVTSSEENSSHFEVERSIDNKSWTKIGVVNASGNSYAEQHYQFDDSNLKLIANDDRIFYYRLKAVDLDSKFDFSEIRNLQLDYEDIVISIYPNPTTEGFWIRATHPRTEREELSYTLVDISGNTVQANTLGNAKEINQFVKLSKEIASGTYMLNINTAAQNIRSERLVIIGQQ